MALMGILLMYISLTIIILVNYLIYTTFRLVERSFIAKKSGIPWGWMFVPFIGRFLLQKKVLGIKFAVISAFFSLLCIWAWYYYYIIPVRINEFSGTGASEIVFLRYNIFFILLFYSLIIGFFILRLVFCLKLSSFFGIKKLGFITGMFFIPIVFEGILAFGKSLPPDSVYTPNKFDI